MRDRHLLRLPRSYYSSVGRLARIHLRAPLNTFVLYEAGNYVFKAKVYNISEGGLLLENLPCIPDVLLVPLMINLPGYFEFSKASEQELLETKAKGRDGKIFRARVKIVRSFEKINEIDKLFISNIGCQFIALGEGPKAEVSEYIQIFTKNIIYLLGLFESANNNSKKKKLIRQVASLLGYDGEMKFSYLRQKILHDYQSLERA